MSKNNEKEEPRKESPLDPVCRPGGVLLSQDPAVQVPSALEGLTVVFGMGTRGTPPPSLPDRLRSLLRRTVRLQTAMFNMAVKMRDSVQSLRLDNRIRIQRLLIIQA